MWRHKMVSIKINTKCKQYKKEDQMTKKSINMILERLANKIIELKPNKNSVVERFKNPFIRHELMSISLNSTTKFKTRLLPTYNDYIAKFGKAPAHILFAFASLVVFFKGKRGEEDIALNDSPEYLEFWSKLWKNDDVNVIAKTALSASDLWEQDLANDETVALVASYISDILTLGERAALQKFLNA
jgi:tagaturonate reductase